MNRPSYNPTGVCKNPIPVRLMDEERRQADEIASQAGVSRGKVLREAIVAGLPAVREMLLGAPAATRTAELADGQAPASPATLSSLAA